MLVMEPGMSCKHGQKANIGLYARKAVMVVQDNAIMHTETNPEQDTGGQANIYDVKRFLRHGLQASVACFKEYMMQGHAGSIKHNCCSRL